MELLELKQSVLELFEIDDISKLGEKLKDITLNNKNEYYRKFKELVVDLDQDHLQKIYQYYLADREKNKQDFTPFSLAKLVARLSDGEDEVIDMCSGIGSLTIQRWKVNKNSTFICKELDERAIPFLLFNLAIRNIQATVFHMDVLENEIYHIYQVNRGNEFSTIRRLEDDNDK